MLSVFYDIFAWIGRHDSDTWARTPERVRAEVRAARRLLSLCFGDVTAGVLPVLFAQDAEGDSNRGLGGWGLGVGFPDEEGLLRVLSESIGRGVPRDMDLSLSCISALQWVRTGDEQIPLSWTDGTLPWHDVLARAHSYHEHITVCEARVLLRSYEIAAKIPQFRRARMLALEDNQAVKGSWAKGRSAAWPLNQILRRRAAIEGGSSIELATAWVGTLRMPLDKLSRERIVRRTSCAH